MMYTFIYLIKEIKNKKYVILVYTIGRVLENPLIFRTQLVLKISHEKFAHKTSDCCFTQKPRLLSNFQYCQFNPIKLERNICAYRQKQIFIAPQNKFSYSHSEWVMNNNFVAYWRSISSDVTGTHPFCASDCDKIKSSSSLQSEIRQHEFWSAFRSTCRSFSRNLQEEEVQ